MSPGGGVGPVSSQGARRKGERGICCVQGEFKCLERRMDWQAREIHSVDPNATRPPCLEEIYTPLLPPPCLSFVPPHLRTRYTFVGMMARGQTESPDKPCTPSVRWSDERMRDKRTAVPATPWRPRILRRDLSIDIDQPSPLDRKVTLPPLKLMRDDPVFSPAPSSATLVPSAEKHDEPKGDAYRCTPNSPFLPRAPPNTTSKPDHALRSANLQETDAQALLRQGGGMNKAGETNVYVNGLPKE